MPARMRCGVVFAVLGLPYAVLLGVLAGVLEFIPLVGPFLVAVIAVVVAVLAGVELVQGVEKWTSAS